MLANRRVVRGLGLVAAVSTLASLVTFSTPAPAAAAAPIPNVEVRPSCPTPGPGQAQCLALEVVGPVGANLAHPNILPAGFGPADLQSAYHVPTGLEGSGMTVAIVDAFDWPLAEQDLAEYRAAFGLPPCTTANGCFRKVNQLGQQADYPNVDYGWGTEIDLDIEMVSATCPHCNILLVETETNNLSDLGAGVNTAVSLGAIAVSNSYGGTETGGSVALDQAYYNHPGIAITASTGDCGWNCTGSYPTDVVEHVEYPAASPYVVAVGGTSLVQDGTTTRGWRETAWGNLSNGGAGSGCSMYEPKPSWQTDGGCENRTQADVSAVADPATGMAVRFNSGWHVFGGTSASSPIIASLFAMAGGPAPGDYPASYLYSHPTALYDVVGGGNDVKWGSCASAGSYLCTGVAGYDGPTGLGTPNGLAAFAAPAAIPPTPGTYHPITPTRLLDTRIGNGLVGTLVARTPRTFQVTGRGGIPAGATAVTGNVTVVNSFDSWAVYLGPTPLASPTTSTVNFAASQVRGNGVTLALSNAGTLSATYMSSAGNRTDLVLDVTGYFTPDTTGATYHALTPVRLLDTRTGNGMSGPIRANVPRTFQVTGRGGIPSNATAVTGNVTAVNQTSGWAVYLGPVSSPVPTTSSVNFVSGEATGNNLTVALAAGGKLSTTYMSGAGNTADLVFDVTGYYTADLTGSMFVPITPARLLDTRSGNGLSGKLAAGSPRSFQVAGRGGIPANAGAVAGNVTVVNQTNAWAVYLGPSSSASPTTSTINFVRYDVKGNGLTVALSSGRLYATYMSTAGNTTDLVFDVTGYYVRPSA